MRRNLKAVFTPVVGVVLSSSLALAIQDPKPGVPDASGKAGIDFLRDVKPILSQHCFQCHGPDEAARKGKLRLDLKDDAFAAKKEKHVIAPGNLDDSLVYERITTDNDRKKMPPEGKAEPLTAKQIETIKTWIEQGAVWKEHWSFVAPQKQELPVVQHKEWVRDPMDAFVLKKMEVGGLAPEAEAPKEMWLRRASFDLTGLPPTPAEIDAFLKDSSANAYEKQVDRLLASTRFGERQAQEWLDLSRYADTGGYQNDQPRKVWKWREWVIQAYNANMPFDQFTIEQLAGDLLPNATLAQKVATGFNRNHPTNSEAGEEEDEYRSAYVIDRVNTTATTFLGLTMACAQCHDHKYDPVSQKDYYSFYSFFNNIKERDSDFRNPRPTISVPTPAQEPKLLDIKNRVKAFQARLDQDDPLTDAAQADWEKKMRAALGENVTWVTAEPIGMLSRNGSILKRLEDGTILSTGMAPVRDTYDVVIQPGKKKIAALRIEVLPHESMPEKGNGRSTDGRFVMSALEIRNTTLSESQEPPLLYIVKAEADINQKMKEDPASFDMAPGAIESAIVASPVGSNEEGGGGGRGFGGGWSIVDNARFEAHEAVVLPLNTLELNEASILRISMHQAGGGKFKSLIGRFRISYTEDESIRRHLLPAHGKLWSAVGPFAAEDVTKAWETVFAPEKDIENGLDTKKSYEKVVLTPAEGAKGGPGAAGAPEGKPGEAKDAAPGKPEVKKGESTKPEVTKPEGAKAGAGKIASADEPADDSLKTEKVAEAVAQDVPTKEESASEAPVVVATKVTNESTAETPAGKGGAPPGKPTPEQIEAMKAKFGKGGKGGFGGKQGGVGKFTKPQDAPDAAGAEAPAVASQGVDGDGAKAGDEKVEKAARKEGKPADAPVAVKGEKKEEKKDEKKEDKKDEKPQAPKKKAEKVTFVEQPKWRDGNPGRIEGASGTAAYYLTRKVMSTGPRTAMMQVDGPSAFKVWINGTVAYTSPPSPQSAAPAMGPMGGGAAAMFAAAANAAAPAAAATAPKADGKPGAPGKPGDKDKKEKKDKKKEEEEMAPPEFDIDDFDFTGRRGGSREEKKFRVGLKEGENEIVIKAIYQSPPAGAGGRGMGGPAAEMANVMVFDFVGGGMGRRGGGGASFTFDMTPEGEDVLNYEVAMALRHSGKDPLPTEKLNIPDAAAVGAAPAADSATPPKSGDGAQPAAPKATPEVAPVPSNGGAGAAGSSAGAENATVANVNITVGERRGAPVAENTKSDDGKKMPVEPVEKDEKKASLVGEKSAPLVRDETAPKLTPVQYRRKVLRDYYRSKIDPVGRVVYEEMQKLKDEEKKIKKELPETLVMEEREKPREAFIFKRGLYKSKGPVVSTNTPEVLPAMAADLPKNRLGLAKWIVSRENPLTARVFVNRIWQQYFGAGFVATPEDFGIRCDVPSNADLLDSLAVEFMESGWDIKKLHKRIVLSATYRQSSVVSAEKLEKDPENRLLARGPRLRLSAEMIRDNALAISGLLFEKVGGESVKPYQPKNAWKTVEGNSGSSYVRDKDEKQYRRGLYVYWKRGSPYPSMLNFDAVKRDACTVTRAYTTTPLQALTLLNDPVYVECAKMLGQRMLKDKEVGREKNDQNRLIYGFRLCTSRKPTGGELDILTKLLNDAREHFKSDADAAAELNSTGDSKVDESIDAAESAAWALVGNALFNMDSTIRRG